ncbi:hypothetical protein CLNEO_25020 [Anaerotignum neopropionicum]|uniref:Uncharacterized protein n=1 Tax=Anaerotignum neopropionicum TaxID=36847 RepID=A0A136WCB5_9FIRM|nr:hypothetical protein [Anaerotignum neopropionicum]KXL52153.1 hypothetical protein CLNEO_25020 [Anaerotignum neopropionicum]
MKKKIWGFLIVLVLTLLSVLIYAVQIVVFHSPRDTGFYIFQDIAFLPLQIAIVTVVLGSYLKRREKIERLKKINIVINAFFNEAGTDILKGLIGFSKNYDKTKERLNVQTDWTDKMFSETVRYLINADMKIEYSIDQLDSLTVLMKNKRNFLIRLLENPNLLEHDTFTDMLLSVFHVMEELMARDTFEVDNKADMEHLSNDIQRALKALLIEWVEYMRHLRLEYPYLYSFMVRKNLFSEERNIMIRK